MAIKKFSIVVNSIIEVTIDEDKLDEQFCKDYEETIGFRASHDDENKASKYAQRVAWLYYLTHNNEFGEGFGDYSDMNIKVAEVDGYIDDYLEIDYDETDDD